MYIDAAQKLRRMDAKMALPLAAMAPTGSVGTTQMWPAAAAAQATSRPDWATGLVKSSTQIGRPDGTEMPARKTRKLIF